MSGGTGLLASRPAAAPAPVGTQWENLAQLTARSVAMRQNTTTGAPQTSIVAAEPIHNEALRAVDDDRPPWDLVPVPDDGHLPMHEADMELAHLHLREGRSSSSDTRLRSWRLRNAHLTEHMWNWMKYAPPVKHKTMKENTCAD